MLVWPLDVLKLDHIQIVFDIDNVLCIFNVHILLPLHIRSGWACVLTPGQSKTVWMVSFARAPTSYEHGLIFPSGTHTSISYSEQYRSLALRFYRAKTNLNLNGFNFSLTLAQIRRHHIQNACVSAQKSD